MLSLLFLLSHCGSNYRFFGHTIFRFFFFFLMYLVLFLVGLAFLHIRKISKPLRVHHFEIFIGFVVRVPEI